MFYDTTQIDPWLTVEANVWLEIYDLIDPVRNQAIQETKRKILFAQLIFLIGISGVK